MGLVLPFDSLCTFGLTFTKGECDMLETLGHYEDYSAGHLQIVRSEGIKRDFT